MSPAHSRTRIRLALVGWVFLPLLQGCGSSPPVPEPPESTSSDLITESSPTTDAANEFAAAITDVFEHRSGALTRRTRAVVGGFGVDQVTRLDWLGDAGRVTREITADPVMLETPAVREQLELMSSEASAGDSELRGADLQEVKAAVRSSILALLDGVELQPDGFGWWSGRIDTEFEIETLEVHLVDGMLQRVSRSVETSGAIGSDTWEFGGGPGSTDSDFSR